MRMLRAACLDGIPHGFFGREGGVSTGVYASLNCGPGSGDLRANVIENRRRALAAIAPEGTAALVTLYQVHSGKAVIVDAPWDIGEGPQADGMATRHPGIALGILTADCAPVLFADRERGVIGAAHAGWKGAFNGIIEATLAAMVDLGAQRSTIAAAIGPAISQANYEVDETFRARFLADDATLARFFADSRREGHWQFDLDGYVAGRLAKAGVGRIARLGTCTYANEAAYFSFRRTTHRGEKDYGRDISAILLPS